MKTGSDTSNTPTTPSVHTPRPDSRREARDAKVSRVGKLTPLAPTTAPAADTTSLLDADRRRKSPKLRLVGERSIVKPAITPQQHDPITDTADPRWVLAVRTAEQLEGSILRPERRESLLRLGKVFGLTPFDANLVIAIVQDQARRGHAPAYCPSAGEPQLRMVPPARRRPWTLRRWLTLGTCTAMFIAAEVAVFTWFFAG